MTGDITHPLVMPHHYMMQLTLFTRDILSAQVFISEISPLFCDDSSLSMLQPNTQVAFISTKGYGESAIEKLVELWDQIILSYLHPGKTWVAGSAIYILW